MIDQEPRVAAPRPILLDVVHPEGGGFKVSVSLSPDQRYYYVDEHPDHFIPCEELCTRPCVFPREGEDMGCLWGGIQLRGAIKKRLVGWGYPPPGVRER